MSIDLFNADCLEALVQLDDDCIDSLVTDPPAGISFMGKDWDSDKGGSAEWIAWMTDVAKECLRVMKPGAHGFVWAIPRTSHWTATALELAGFEIRDVVTHLFGSGFPKSLDVSKAIDKAAGAEREVTRAGQTKALEFAGKFDQAAAKQWSGWGTALKPASEHWILIRKPLGEKTVAKNVLKHGTGGINIDASRVEGKAASRAGGDLSNRVTAFEGGERVRTDFESHSQGRFPANLVLSCCGQDPHEDGCAVAELDAQSGHIASGYRMNPSTQSGSAFHKNGGAGERGYKDSGGASRFFYCAKTSKSERNAGLDEFTAKSNQEREGRTGQNNSKVRPDGSERAPTAHPNNHPTVKPQRLMEYLIGMITPPNGTVLDPFMGSGSTGVAAKRLGFKFIGIEREQEYHAIAEARIGA